MRMFAFCVSSSEQWAANGDACCLLQIEHGVAQALLCGAWCVLGSGPSMSGFQRGRNTDVRTFVSCQGGLYNKRRSIYRCSRLTPPPPPPDSSPPCGPSFPPAAAAVALLRVLFALEATLVRGRAVNCNALRVPAREAEHWQLAESDTARQQCRATSDNAC